VLCRISCDIVLPDTVLLTISDLGINRKQLSLAEDDSSQDFDGSMRARMSGTAIDFRAGISN
jgi:hypothetical protein